MLRTTKQMVNTYKRVIKHKINGTKSIKQYLTMLIKKPMFSKILTKNIIFAKDMMKIRSFSSGNIPLSSFYP